MQTRQASEPTIACRHRIIHKCIPAPKRRDHIPIAAPRAMSRRPRNINKCSGKAKIQYHAKQAEECNTSKAADEQ